MKQLSNSFGQREASSQDLRRLLSSDGIHLARLKHCMQYNILVSWYWKHKEHEVTCINAVLHIFLSMYKIRFNTGKQIPSELYVERTKIMYENHIKWH